LNVDWDKVVEWDKKYYLRIKQSSEEWTPVPVERVEGCYIITPDGTKILDFLSGLISVNAGQRQPRVIEAIKHALDRYGYVWEVMQTPYKSLAAKLIVEDILGKDGWAGKVRFTSSGSEANEEALIIAKLYTGKPFIISREFSYHGWTLGAGSCSTFRWWRGTLANSRGEYREVPGFPAQGFFVARAPFCYRCPYGYDSPSDCQSGGYVACLRDLEYMIQNLGPQNVAAIITEIISGGGLVVSPPE